MAFADSQLDVCIPSELLIIYLYAKSAHTHTHTSGQLETLVSYCCRIGKSVFLVYFYFFNIFNYFNYFWRF
jgi:hypothetical protein